MLTLQISYGVYVAGLQMPHWDFALDYTFIKELARNRGKSRKEAQLTAFRMKIKCEENTPTNQPMMTFVRPIAEKELNLITSVIVFISTQAALMVSLTSLLSCCHSLWAQNPL